MVINTIEDSVASFEEWCELEEEFKKLHRLEPEMCAYWDSNNCVLEIQRGVDIHAQIRRLGRPQALSQYTTGRKWDVGHHTADGKQQFKKFARLWAMRAGYRELKGEEACGQLIICLKNYCLEQDGRLKETVGFLGDHEGASIRYLAKAAAIYCCELASHAPATDIMGQRKIQDGQVGLDTAKAITERKTKIDGEADSQQNALIVQFSKTGKGWRIDYGSNKIILNRHYAGVDCYRVLVTHSDRTMSALEIEALAGGTSDDQPARSREVLEILSDLGDSSYDPKVDKTTLREVEDCRDRLQERLESTPNPEESSSIQEELERLEKYLSSATRRSRSGKVLKVHTNKTPLRQASEKVRRNIGTFLEQIEHYDLSFSLDLRRGLQLGDNCKFTPDPHRLLDFKFT